MFLNLRNHIIQTLGSLLGVVSGFIKNIIMTIHRIDIKSDEIALLMGVAENTARRYMREIKKVYDKKKHQKITITEFCEYFDLPYKTVFCQVNKMKFEEYEKLVHAGYIENPMDFVQKTI